MSVRCASERKRLDLVSIMLTCAGVAITLLWATFLYSMVWRGMAHLLER